MYMWCGFISYILFLENKKIYLAIIPFFVIINKPLCRIQIATTSNWKIDSQTILKIYSSYDDPLIFALPHFLRWQYQLYLFQQDQAWGAPLIIYIYFVSMRYFFNIFLNSQLMSL